MNDEKQQPERTCIGCRSRRPKAQLLRLVAGGGQVALDAQARLPGRGAYVCGPACAKKALAQGALGRAFRQKVGAAALLEFVEQNPSPAGSAERPTGSRVG